MKSTLKKIEDFINKQINRLGKKTCLVVGIFIGLLVGVLTQ